MIISYISGDLENLQLFKRVGNENAVLRFAKRDNAKLFVGIKTI